MTKQKINYNERKVALSFELLQVASTFNKKRNYFLIAMNQIELPARMNLVSLTEKETRGNKSLTEKVTQGNKPSTEKETQGNKPPRDKETQGKKTID